MIKRDEIKMKGQERDINDWSQLPTCELKTIYRSNKLINYGASSKNPLRSVNQISRDDGRYYVFSCVVRVEEKISIKNGMILHGSDYA